jgi:hypothetical protein
MKEIGFYLAFMVAASPLVHGVELKITAQALEYTQLFDTPDNRIGAGMLMLPWCRRRRARRLASAMRALKS